VNTRIGKQPLGFSRKSETKEIVTDPFALVRPQDLHKFGLIPEFIGRLPMISSVAPLDREALVRILTEPRNALTKQFAKLFELDGVRLDFTQDAIEAIADQALERGTGARGLRAILEELLLEVMFEVPSTEDVAQVVIHRDAVMGNTGPEFVPRAKLAARRDLSA